MYAYFTCLISSLFSIHSKRNFSYMKLFYVLSLMQTSYTMKICEYNIWKWKKNHFWIYYISFIKDQQKLQSVNTTVANDGIQSKVLRDKLAELEREIEKFRAENVNLDKLRKEREDVSMDFWLKNYKHILFWCVFLLSFELIVTRTSESFL